MNKIPYPTAPDLSKFQPENKPSEVKYGLPEDIVFCKKCVVSNQRPNSSVEFTHTKDSKKTTINFDEDGVCDACRFAEKKEQIDWAERERQLQELCDRHRSKDGSFDCLAPGSGGKDSVYAAHILKYKYNMHPLTVTWAPHIYTDWGRKNFDTWIHAGFDNILYTANGLVHRLLTRLAVDNLFHPFQPFIFGQKNIAPKVAALHNIPLVFYGENEAEYGNPIAETSSATRDTKYFSSTGDDDLFLSGIPAASLKSDFGITKADLDFYLPADPEKLAQGNTEIHYLGHYLKWHPQSCYYYVQELGFEPSPERTPGTYSKYNSIDDRIDDFHYYTTFIKFGIGRATSDAAQEIRSDDIMRDEGVALVRRYDGEFPDRFAEEIFKYLSIPKEQYPVASSMFEQPIMDRTYFDTLTDQHRSPHIWKRENDEWALRNAVWHHHD